MIQRVHQHENDKKLACPVVKLSKKNTEWNEGRDFLHVSEHVPKRAVVNTEDDA